MSVAPLDIPRRHAELFSDARIALTNARDLDDVQQILADYEHDVEKLNTGLTLLAEAEKAAQAVITRYAERLVATTELQQAVTALRKTYTRHVQLARVIIEPGTAGYVELKLKGRRTRSQVGLAKEARTFYALLLEDTALRARLTGVRIDEAACTEGLALVTAFDDALTARQLAHAEAVSSTDERDEAVQRLEKFMSRLRAVARIALEDHPQMVEKLGFMERS